MHHAPNRRPSPALLVAVIALVLALTGAATALPGKNSVDKNDLGKGVVKSKAIKKNAVKNKHVADGAIGEAELAGAEASHLVGAAGEPPFETGGDGDCFWHNANTLAPAASFAPVSFYKDPYDRVNLGGTAIQEEASGGDGDCGETSTTDNSRDQVAFILPPGHRPANTLLLPIVAGTLLVVSDAGLQVTAPPDLPLPPGAVAISADPGETASFETFSFRAADAATAAANRAGAPDRIASRLLKLR